MLIQSLIWVFMLWGCGLAVFANAVYNIGRDDEPCTTCLTINPRKEVPPSWPIPQI